MVDGVVLLIDAQEGPMPQTRFVTKKALAWACAHRRGQQGRQARCRPMPSSTPPSTCSTSWAPPTNSSTSPWSTPRASTAGPRWKRASPARAMGPRHVGPVQHRAQARACAKGDRRAAATADLALDFRPSWAASAWAASARARQARPGRGRDGRPRGKTVNGRINQVLTFQGSGPRASHRSRSWQHRSDQRYRRHRYWRDRDRPGQPAPLPMLKVDEPTLTMNFCVNTSPLAGREGKFVTSRQIWDRLQRTAAQRGLRVKETDETASSRCAAVVNCT